MNKKEINKKEKKVTEKCFSVIKKIKNKKDKENVLSVLNSIYMLIIEDEIDPATAFIRQSQELKHPINKIYRDSIVKTLKKLYKEQKIIVDKEYKNIIKRL